MTDKSIPTITLGLNKDLDQFLNSTDVPSSDKTNTTALEQALEDKKLAQEEALDTPKTRSKTERYEDALREHGISKDEAAKVINDLLEKMYYEEEVYVTKKLKVTFRTRTPKQIEMLNDEIANRGYVTQFAVNLLTAKYNLAASLVKVGNSVLDPSTPEGFAESLDFVERLPGPLFNLLVEKLRKFDDKMNTIVQDGCVENF